MSISAMSSIDMKELSKQAVIVILKITFGFTGYFVSPYYYILETFFTTKYDDSNGIPRTGNNGLWIDKKYIQCYFVSPVSIL